MVTRIVVMMSAPNNRFELESCMLNWFMDYYHALFSGGAAVATFTYDGMRGAAQLTAEFTGLVSHGVCASGIKLMQYDTELFFPAFDRAVLPTLHLQGCTSVRLTSTDDFGDEEVYALFVSIPPHDDAMAADSDNDDAVSEYDSTDISAYDSTEEADAADAMAQLGFTYSHAPS
jgi:hypothetical protein